MISIVISTIEMEIDYVISHGSCSDGTMCKAIVKRFLKSKQVTYMDAFYKTDYSYLPPLLYGKSVLICDFSFPKEIFEEIVKYTKGNVFIIDHHKTSKQDLKDIDPKYKRFDQEHCAAYLVWKYFTSKPVPKAVLYVEDYDLWKFSLPDTKEITSYIKTLNFDIDKYESLLDGFPKDTISIGKGLVLAETNNIRNIANKAIPLLVKIQEKYYFVPHVFSHILKSEIGNFLLTLFPSCSFSIVYSVNNWNQTTSMSLRSEDSRTDVSQIAKLFGGGGHRNASGIEVKYPTYSIPTEFVDDGRCYHLLSKITVDEEGVAFVPEIKYKDHFLSFLLQERQGKKEIEHILGKSVSKIVFN